VFSKIDSESENEIFTTYFALWNFAREKEERKKDKMSE
jgi:hypothetical protein